MKALVVEDDFVNRKLLQSILSHYGTCDIAVDGKEAIDAFITALYTDKPYDLICLDIMMPKIDGYKTLEKIREVETEQGIDIFKGVKVIMTTGLSGYNDVSRAYESQCTSYLVKPIEKQKLLDVLKEHALI